MPQTLMDDEEQELTWAERLSDGFFMLGLTDNDYEPFIQYPEALLCD